MKERQEIQQVRRIQSNNSIAVVLATYNGERFFEEQLASLACQTRLPTLVMISDDGSSDETIMIAELFKKHAPFEVVIRRNKTEGDTNSLKAMWNFMNTLRDVDADYIFFCDQDDIWMPEKIEKTVTAIDAIEKNVGQGTPVLVACDSVIVDENLNILYESSFTRGHIANGAYGIGTQLIGNRFQGCMMGFNRALRELVVRGNIVPEITMHDAWTASIALSCGVFGIIKEPLLLYRIHEDNVCGKLNNNKAKENLIRRVKKSLVLERKHMMQREERARLLLELFEVDMDDSSRKIVSSFAGISRLKKVGRVAILLSFGVLRLPKKSAAKKILAI